MKTYDSSMSLYVSCLDKLLNNPEYKCSPRGLFIHEDIGWSARISNPRDRLINLSLRKWDIVYSLGEFLWYVTGSNSLKMISYYAPSYTRFSDDGDTLYGAYGPRMFGPNNNINSVIKTLKKDPDSRQAILLVWRERDMWAETKDYPCTVYLHFLIRENKLCMIANMRSNDVWLGIPNDIFCFTMIQELVASMLGLELGFYQHNDGSLHMYENTIKKIKENPGTGLQTTPMDKIDNFHGQLKALVDYEMHVRGITVLTNPPQADEPEIMSLKYKDISPQINDLMWVLYYGRCRKIHKEYPDSKSIFEKNVEKALQNIKQECIKNCIRIYERSE